MKLYAQMGHADSDKTSSGLAEGIIDGAIISPRNWRPDVIVERIDQLTASKKDADILLDPQFYATFAASTESARTGKLTEWPYFRATCKSDLETATNIEEILEQTFEHMLPIPLTAIIAPNIYVSRSFDSREGVIAKNFIRSARPVYETLGDGRPLFVTLAVSREALLERGEFEDFLNDITMLPKPPDGFYIVVGSRGTEARTDIYHADVIARWMILNYSLSINGFKIINGYSDSLAPFLGAAGATAGASGWYSNLRTFSMDRFHPAPSFARQPILRYFSCRLLNRITFTEREALSTIFPGALNSLPHDADYTPEPDRTAEALQSWEALRQISVNMSIGDIESALESCSAAIKMAEAAYSTITEAGVTLDRKSGDYHLEPLREGIQTFKKMAGFVQQL